MPSEGEKTKYPTGDKEITMNNAYMKLIHSVIIFPNEYLCLQIARVITFNCLSCSLWIIFINWSQFNFNHLQIELTSKLSATEYNSNEMRESINNYCTTVISTDVNQAILCVLFSATKKGWNVARRSLNTIVYFDTVRNFFGVYFSSVDLCDMDMYCVT